MNILLSTIGSRGDVQPLVALAAEIRALGHQARFCVAPNFTPWLTALGFDNVPLSIDVAKWTRARAEGQQPPPPPSPAQAQEMARQSIIDQFQALTEAARDCDLLLAGGALLTAGRSVAEAYHIPYVYVAYCPVTLPSLEHPPAKMGTPHSPSLTPQSNRRLWRANDLRFQHLFGDAVNEQRAALRLSPIDHISRYITTDRPWLASDPILGPAATPPTRMQIVQTGAWCWHDPTPLPEPLERFLANGAPPVYFGFGSMRATPQTSRTLIEAARAVGQRAIISQGWSNLSVIDDGFDCISIDDVSHAQLFPHVAAVVHHGGAGTTTAAAYAGKPQVLIPHLYDQFYWAQRVQKLGVGTAGPAASDLSVDSLTAALRQSLQPEMATRAQALANQMEAHGARIAAEKLISEFG